jgi:branched-chain amino acid transport system substrate-binding protein
MRRLYRPLAAAAVTLAVLLDIGSPAHAQISDAAVRIGMLEDMSSLYSETTGPGSVYAARMAVADFGGKVLGKPIEILQADHQNKADVGSAIARRWIDNEGVDVIVDVPTSSVALAVQFITKERNRVMLASGPAVSDLTGSACSPTGIHWTYDTYALSHGPIEALVKQGLDSWFFVAGDYAAAQVLQTEATDAIKRAGGKVIGGVRAPFGSSDFSSFLLQAQASKARVIALANAGGDAVTAIKQAWEFGLPQGGQKLFGFLLTDLDIHAIGLATAQDMLLTTAFYWDRTDETRAWSKRFFMDQKRMPTMYQAGVYSAVLHYLKAVEAAGTDEAQAVVAKMREVPVHDFFAEDGHVREDGRMVHDMYVMRVKKPSESKSEWDLYELLATIPGERAFRPMSEGGCPSVKP